MLGRVRQPTTVVSDLFATTGCPEPSAQSPPVEGDDGWLLAAGRGFVYLSPDGSLRWPAKLARTEEEHSGSAH